MAVDCLVIGGGVIGLTTAWKLAQQGLSVRVCDQSKPGQEASWAGAGILPPGLPGNPTDALVKLTAWTCALWPNLSAELLDTTGVDGEFQRCGGVELSVGSRDDLHEEYLRWTAIGARAEWMGPDDIRRIEPGVSISEPGFLLPDLCQIRNPRHLRAVLRACELAGVEVTADCPITGWNSNSGRMTGAITPQGNISAGEFIVTAGAWSSTLLSKAGIEMSTVPVRGQILQLPPGSVPLSRVIERGKRYIVPRRDGRILIGSTEEWVGFHKENTPEGTDELLTFAARICPAMKDAVIESRWSGLRPSAVRGRPFIGRAPGWKNLLVATGHFRAGLHLSPATAKILVDLACGRTVAPDWDSFGF